MLRCAPPATLLLTTISFSVHTTRFASNVGMCAPVTPDAIQAMSYRALQQACKLHGLPAKGKADLLRTQLLDTLHPAAGEQTREEAGLLGRVEEAAGLDSSGGAPSSAPLEEQDGLYSVDPNAAAVSEHSLSDEWAYDMSDEEETPSPPPDTRGEDVSPSLAPEDAAFLDDLLSEDGDLFASDPMWDDLENEQEASLQSEPNEPAATPLARSAVAQQFDDNFDASDTQWLDALLEEEFASPSIGAGEVETASGNPLRQKILDASARDQHDRVLTLYSQWQEEGIEVDQAVSSAALKSCAANGEWELAAGMVNALEDAGFTPSPEQIDAAVRACDKKLKWQEALALLDRCIQSGARPLTRSFESAIRACAKAKQPKMVSGGERWEGHVNCMVLFLWDTIKSEASREDQPLELTTRTVSVIVRSLSVVLDRSKYAKSVLEVVDFVQARGIELDITCYKNALRACDLAGAWRRALDMLDSMREAGLQPDVLTYSNAMSACARDGRSQTALRLLADMRADGLQPNAFCYNAVVSACARAAQWRQGISILHEMEEESTRLADPMIAPTVHTYATVIKSCSMDAQWRTATQLLHRLIRSGLEPTAYHYGCVIDACAKAGQLSKVMSLFVELQSRGLQPDKRSFRNAIIACTSENQLNRALSLIERMYKVEVAPDVATYDILMKACDKQGKADVIWQLVESMPKLGVEPNLVNYNTAVRAMCRAGDFARTDQVFSLMTERNVPPEFSTYRAAINGSCEAGFIDVAVNYLDQLKALGFAPDLSIKVRRLKLVADSPRTLVAKIAAPTEALAHLMLCAPALQYALLSTCGDEARPFLESSLEANSEDVFRARLEREHIMNARRAK
ncbi:MAG: hypothetical protein SGPRY_005734 [Prymnesium sp.]